MTLEDVEVSVHLFFDTIYMISCTCLTLTTCIILWSPSVQRYMVNYIKTSPLILGPFYSSRESTSLVPYSFYNKTSSNINIRVTNNYNHNSIQDVQNINKNNAMILTCCYVTWWDAKCSSSCFCLLLLISSAFCCANRNVFQSSCCHWNFFLKIYIKYGFMRYKNSVFNIHSSKQ